MPAYKDEARNTWYASFDYIDWQGIRRRKKKRGFALKREALDFEREFKLKHAGEPNMLFSSLVELYYDDCTHRVRNSTLSIKKNMIDTHIVPYFGQKKASEIDKTDIRHWQNSMLKKKNPKTNAPYSPTYLHSINSQMSAIMNFGVEYYGLSQNPCQQIKSIGKKKADEMKFWTIDQFNNAIKYAESKPGYHTALTLLFWGGLRVGELLALTPRMVIDSTNSVSIKKTYKRENSKDKFDDPKTPNSIRTVAYPPFAFNALKSYMGMLYGLGPDDKIFYFQRQAVNKELNEIARLSGEEKIRVHDLRHSHVALLIELGYSVHAIAARIGDTPEEVYKTYGHLYPDKDAQIARELENHKNGISHLSNSNKNVFDFTSQNIFNKK